MLGKQNEYDAMAECEKSLWWYRSLHELTLRKISKLRSKEVKILDAGCGTGGMLDYLYRNGYSNITGFDLSSNAIEHARKNRAFQVELLSIMECDRFYNAESFDVIICNDIICLLKDGDDEIALTKLRSLIKPNGLLLMNLPSGKYFRGTHDVACEVVRRYSKHQLKTLAQDAGWELAQLKHWPFLLSPIIFTVRSFQRFQLLLSKNRQFQSDVKMLPPVLNNLFLGITRFENRTMTSKPWGSSIFSVMIRKEI
jgi:SAM-dependent methyltransferase